MPEVVPFKAPPKARTRAVTWHQLDAVIAQSHGRHRKLLVLMRYTGRRVNQAMQLLWSDVDMKRAILHLRPELGKSTAEKVGREIPMSPHLVAELAMWGTRSGYLAPIGDKTSRKPRGRDVWRFWERAGIDPMYWRGRPHHAFRKALISCLKAQGIDPEAIEYYVGHDLEIRGTCADPWALDLAAIATAIPEIGEAPEDHEHFVHPRPLRLRVWPWSGQRVRRILKATVLTASYGDLAEAQGNRTPPGRLSTPCIGFEDRAAHQDRRASAAYIGELRCPCHCAAWLGLRVPFHEKNGSRGRAKGGWALGSGKDL